MAESTAPPQSPPAEKPDGPTGLTQRPGGPEEKPPRTDDEIVKAAEQGEAISHHEVDALTGYFLGDKPKPGTSPQDIAEVEVDLGRSGAKWKCTVKPVSWTQWQEAQLRGEKPDGRIDALTIAAWIVAQALVEPALGPLVQRLQREKPGEAPEHAPALLLDFFEKQPGSLLELNAKVLELSKLQNQNEAVREIEAGKT